VKKFIALGIVVSWLGGCKCGGGAVDAITIGPEGGTLTSATGVKLEVPPGAVDSKTEFSIEKVASSPMAAAGNEIVGGVYKLEPHDKTFAKPVRVTLPVASGTTGKLVLLRYPEAGSEWVPMGGGGENVTAITAYTTHFSYAAIMRIVQGVFMGAGCYAPTDCGLSCGPSGAFPPSSCTGTCSVAGTNTIAGVSCSVPSGTTVRCSCVNPPSGLTPRHTEPLELSAWSAIADPYTALYLAATWCGWPCGTAPDAGGGGAGGGDDAGSGGGNGGGNGNGGGGGANTGGGGGTSTGGGGGSSTGGGTGAVHAQVVFPAPSGGVIAALRIVGSNLYWSQFSPTSVVTGATSGGGSQKLADLTGVPLDIAVHPSASSVYWTDSSTAGRMSQVLLPGDGGSTALSTTDLTRWGLRPIADTIPRASAPGCAARARS
jgi:hypothetical protein